MIYGSIYMIHVTRFSHDNLHSVIQFTLGRIRTYGQSCLNSGKRCGMDRYLTTAASDSANKNSCICFQGRLFLRENWFSRKMVFKENDFQRKLGFKENWFSRKMVFKENWFSRKNGFQGKWFSGTSAVGGWCRESLMWGQAARWLLSKFNIWLDNIQYLTGFDI